MLSKTNVFALCSNNNEFMVPKEYAELWVAIVLPPKQITNNYIRNVFGLPTLLYGVRVEVPCHHVTYREMSKPLPYTPTHPHIQ